MNEPNLLEMIRKYFSVWVIAGGIGMAIVLLGVFLIAIFAIRAQPERLPSGTAILNIIPAPTDTLPIPSLTVTLTPTPGEQPLPAGGVGVSVGALVQISGTGMDGLRIRAEPSLQGRVKFLGLEAEVFQVKDGPRQADGYTWWFLVALYDETLNGWAVGDYLQVFQNP